MAKKIIFYCLIITLGIIALIFYQKIKFDDGKLHIVFCDVGQGDAIFIRTPKGEDLLIDGGPDARVLECLSSHMPFWDRTIEMAILTHGQKDHLNGLINVIESYSILYFGNSLTLEDESDTEGLKELRKVIKRKEIKEEKLEVGKRFKTRDGISFTVLWPEAGAISPDPNDQSVVLLMTFREFDALLTGDARSSLGYSKSLPARLAAKRAGRQVELLKVPHHGSRTGLTEGFVGDTSPELAIISVGKSNSYGHPHEETLELLSDVRVLRTDEVGEIEVVSDGKSYWTNLSN